MEKSLKSTAVNYGLYLALILSSLTIIGYAVYLDLFTKWWLGISQMLLVIIFGIVSASKAKSNLGGFISLKDAFTAFFITVAIGIVISALVGMIIFNFVDTEAAAVLQEKTKIITANKVSVFLNIRIIVMTIFYEFYVSILVIPQHRTTDFLSTKTCFLVMDEAIQNALANSL